MRVKSLLNLKISDSVTKHSAKLKKGFRANVIGLEAAISPRESL